MQCYLFNTHDTLHYLKLCYKFFLTLLGNPSYLGIHISANHNNDSFYNDLTSESAFQRLKNNLWVSKSIPLRS